MARSSTQAPIPWDTRVDIDIVDERGRHRRELRGEAQQGGEVYARLTVGGWAGGAPCIVRAFLGWVRLCRVALGQPASRTNIPHTL